MQRRIPGALAALLVAVAVPVAIAQTGSSAPDFGPRPPVAQSNAGDTAALASSSRTEGSDGEIAKNIVDAIVADPVMTGTKITVQPEDGSVTLTGTTHTRGQVKRAGEIASQFAGEGKVVNAIQTEEL